MGMLKEMDIHVRSHLTPLKDEQVSLMRARWERCQANEKSRVERARARLEYKKARGNAFRNRPADANHPPPPGPWGFWHPGNPGPSAERAAGAVGTPGLRPWTSARPW